LKHPSSCYLEQPAKPKAPQNRGAPTIQPGSISGGDLGRLGFEEFTGVCYRDCPRLHGLRDLAHQVDMQQPVL
jgi:hypothetical protein